MADPQECLDLAALKAALNRLLTGASAEEVEFQGGDTVKRRVKYTQVNVNALRRQIAVMEGECAKAKGDTRPRRHAITFGGRCP